MFSAVICFMLVYLAVSSDAWGLLNEMVSNSSLGDSD